MTHTLKKSPFGMDMESVDNAQSDVLKTLSNGQYSVSAPPPVDWPGWTAYTRNEWLEFGIMAPPGAATQEVAYIGGLPNTATPTLHTKGNSFGIDTPIPDPLRIFNVPTVGGAVIGGLLGGPIGVVIGGFIGRFLTPSHT